MTACLLVASLLLSAVEAAAATAPGASPAAAAADASVPALIEAAARQYDKGLLDDALRTLEQAYTLSPLPAILYNIAQVQRSRGDCAAALAAYEKYVEQAGPSDPKRDRAQRWIGEMQACVDRKAPTAPAPTAVPRPDSPAPTRPTAAPSANGAAGLVLAASHAPPATAPPAMLSTTAPPPVAPASDRHRSLRLAGWGLIAAGGLCEIAAVLLQWKAWGIQSEANSIPPDGDSKKWNRLNSEGSGDASWALWTAIAGGALGAGGAAVLIINRPSDQAPPRATVVGWTGSF